MIMKKDCMHTDTRGQNAAVNVNIICHVHLQLSQCRSSALNVYMAVRGMELEIRIHVWSSKGRLILWVLLMDHIQKNVCTRSSKYLALGPRNSILPTFLSLHEEFVTNYIMQISAPYLARNRSYTLGYSCREIFFRDYYHQRSSTWLDLSLKHHISLGLHPTRCLCLRTLMHLGQKEANHINCSSMVMV